MPKVEATKEQLAEKAAAAATSDDAPSKSTAAIAAQWQDADKGGEEWRCRAQSKVSVGGVHQPHLSPGSASQHVMCMRACCPHAVLNNTNKLNQQADWTTSSWSSSWATSKGRANSRSPSSSPAKSPRRMQSASLMCC